MHEHTPHPRRGVEAERARPRSRILQKVTIALSLLFPMSGSAFGQTDILESPPVRTWEENYESLGGDVTVFVARPALHAEPLPGLLLIHGEEGLTPHMKNLARRLAAEEFHVVAPDLLSERGGTPESADLAQSMLEGLAPEIALQNAKSAIGYLIGLDQVSRELGAVWLGRRRREPHAADHRPDDGRRSRRSRAAGRRGGA